MWCKTPKEHVTHITKTPWAKLNLVFLAAKQKKIMTEENEVSTTVIAQQMVQFSDMLRDIFEFLGEIETTVLTTGECKDDDGEDLVQYAIDKNEVIAIHQALRKILNRPALLRIVKFFATQGEQQRNHNYSDRPNFETDVLRDLQSDASNSVAESNP